MKRFEPTLEVIFTLLKKELCFGGYLKRNWAWTWEVYFLSVQ